jgi:large subunit ribosomal protein L16
MRYKKLVVTKFVGNYGLQALELGLRHVKLKPRRTITQNSGASLWIRIFPDKGVTARAAESRMGSGKGVDYWVAVVKPGTIILKD